MHLYLHTHHWWRVSVFYNIFNIFSYRYVVSLLQICGGYPFGAASMENCAANDLNTDALFMPRSHMQGHRTAAVRFSRHQRQNKNHASPHDNRKITLRRGNGLRLCGFKKNMSSLKIVSPCSEQNTLRSPYAIVRPPYIFWKCWVCGRRKHAACHLWPRHNPVTSYWHQANQS